MKVNHLGLSLEFYYDQFFKGSDRSDDPRQEEAESRIIEIFERDETKVYYSRQLEEMLEQEFFHWITNRAMRTLVKQGELRSEVRPLDFGGHLSIVWSGGNRYYLRAAKRLVSLVDEYSDPTVSQTLGDHGEMMVLAAMAKERFDMVDRNANSYQGKRWTETDHDMDFIYEKDGISYGVEVKNTLGYMDNKERKVKIRLCAFLGIKPILVARMMPKTWIDDTRSHGGFSLILKWQLYPPALKELAKRLNSELGLPIDAPRAIQDGTMKRLLDWHSRNP